MPHHIVDHTTIKVCAIVVAEVVTIDGDNHMIGFGQTVSTHVIALLYYDGGRVPQIFVTTFYCSWAFLPF